MPGDGEAQAGAAGFAGARGVHAVEALENARLLGFGDADAGVGDGDDHFGVSDFGADDNFAAGHGVLDGVVEQILQDFGEAAPISSDIGNFAGGLNGDVEFFFGGAVARGFKTRLYELRDADAADFEFEAVGIHLGKLEQVFGEARQAAGVVD